MTLTNDEKEILEGKKGETLRKALESVVRYGEVFNAEKLIKVNHSIHMVTSFGIPLLSPVFSLMDELINAGLKTEYPFTVDPRPIDYKNVPCSLIEKFVFSKIMYGKQAVYEQQLKKVGLASEDAFSCTCYQEEVGNIPNKGDNLAWAESSAVVYANSVLGARTNRNSGILELLSGITGKTPYFGFMTDEGRKASWMIEIKTTKTPEAQVLGSAIGMKVMEEVPYIRGLDTFIGNELNPDSKDYLKDMGAATASNGAVGLFHVENLTPEAVELGDTLLQKEYKTYVIDDAEIQRVKDSYPIMWKDENATPKRCFIGCPHLSYNQIENWVDLIEKKLADSGRKKVRITTIFTAPPAVVEKVKKNTELYHRLTNTGVNLSSICPLMYMNNPLCSKKPIITNSNKLRTYTSCRYFTDEEIAKTITRR
jgi:predicted aconitase